MKILFLCGSLDPGRDGVGDYTRRLAGELICQGHEVQIIALYDKYISGKLEEQQQDEPITISVIRFPAVKGLRQNIRQAKDYVREFNPDWLSLQFVPYAFDPKGLPLGLGSKLAELGRGRKWHIMFHELWVAMEERAPLKQKIWGIMQKRMITGLLKKIHPDLIHTQTKLYQYQLQKFGFSANLLPLFSNILYSSTRKLIQTKRGSSKKTTLSFVIFGHIHPGAPLDAFLNELKSSCTGSAELIMLGRTGGETDLWKSKWEIAGFKVQIVGESSAEKVSGWLASADFGISTTPYLLTAKSGSVAAMRSHGLPVIAIARSWVVAEFKKEVQEGVFEFMPDQPINFDIILSQKFKPQMLREIVSSFHQSLVQIK